MTPPEVGDVIPYSYLWAREREAGEESGRKPNRPCVVVVAVKPAGKDAVLIVVAPITSQQPISDAAIELPGALKRALKLEPSPSWVICSEVNQFDWPGFDLGVTSDGKRTYGRIPKSLLKSIREEIVRARARSTKRDA